MWQHVVVVHVVLFTLVFFPIVQHRFERRDMSYFVRVFCASCAVSLIVTSDVRHQHVADGIVAVVVSLFAAVAVQNVASGRVVRGKKPEHGNDVASVLDGTLVST